MLTRLFKRKKPVQKAGKIPDVKTIEAELKLLADNFINKNSIEIIENGVKTRIPPLKWLYPGYGEYREHAIMPDASEKIATEIVHDAIFVNNFLHDKRDIDGEFGFFVARIEGNYVVMSDHGAKLFSSVRESDVDDYDTLVLIKQSNRLFPKFNKETFSIDFKHIEIFGQVFNKLKSKLSHNYSNLSEQQLSLMDIDIPTYTQSSIKIESSLESYNLFKLSEVLEKLAQDLESVSGRDVVLTIESNIRGMERARDALYGSENASRFYRVIENLEKISEKLNKIKTLYKQYSLKFV